MPRREWDQLTDADRADFKDWIANATYARMQAGKAAYNQDNEKFQGQPLTHLSPELFDALFYAFYAERQREADLERMQELVRAARRAVEAMAQTPSLKSRIFGLDARTKLTEALALFPDFPE